MLSRQRIPTRLPQLAMRLDWGWKRFLKVDMRRAIQFLEKATAAKNITLLPFAGSCIFSNQPDRTFSRQVMVQYREAMKAQSVDE